VSPLTARLALRSPPSVISQAALTLDFYRAIPLSIEVAVFDAAGIASLTGVTSLTLMVKATREGTDAAALMSQTVSSFTSCTAPQWIAGTNEHAVFEFDSAECNLDLSGGAKAAFWLVFKALLSSGDEVILGTGRATCYEANAADAGDPPENPNPGISIASADARYLRWFPDITALTGGGSTALDGIDDTDLPARSRVQIFVADELQDWLLQTSSAAEDSAAGIVRPDTFTTKVWFRVR